MTKNTIHVSNELEGAICRNEYFMFISEEVFVARTRSMRIIRVENCCTKVFVG